MTKIPVVFYVTVLLLSELFISQATFNITDVPAKKNNEVEITVTEDQDVGIEGEEELIEVETNLNSKDLNIETLPTTGPSKSLSVSPVRSRESSVDFTKAPRIVMQPLTQWLVNGKPLRLQLEVAKCPDMTVNWFHNDKPIDTGKTRYG